MSGKKKYSDEFKVKVVMDYLDGHSGGCRMLSDKYGIDRSIIKRWIDLPHTVGYFSILIVHNRSINTTFLISKSMSEPH